MTPDQEEASRQARESAALEWLVRLRQPLSAADRADFAAWRSADHRNADAFAAAERVWRRTQAPAARIAADEAPALSALLAKMDAPQRHAAPRRLSFALIAAAACVLMLVAATIWLERPHLFQDLVADQSTGRGEVRTVALPDGSTAVMDADSALVIDYASGGRRVTVLRGAAFFSVVANGQPFSVAARDGETQVLGTQFEVRLAVDRVVVTVAEGRVAVQPPGGQRETLTAGQRLRYGKGNAHEVSPVEPRDALAWREGRLVFHRARLDEVIEVLNRYRAGRILLLDSALAARTVSGSFPANNTDGALDALRQVVGFRLDSLSSHLVILR